MDNSKNSMNNDKSLCLYCDKAFSNVNDQENHVERDHKAVLNKGKGSLRKSERITKNSSSENSHFAACFYCNNKKIIKSDDLESLFQHLLTAHKDVYFGCKCRTRVLDKVSLTHHRRNCKIGGGKNFKSSSSFSSSSSSSTTTNTSSSSDVVVGGGGGGGGSNEKAAVAPSEKRKAAKKSQSKSNVDAKCDNNSESESISTASAVAAAAAAVATTKNHSVKTLPTNAMNKKSDRSNVKNSNSCKHANNNLNDKRNKSKVISSSSSSISSSSKASDEYTIPLTRQKLKEPAASQKGQQQQHSSGSHTKKPQKNGQKSSSAAAAAAVAVAAAAAATSYSSSSSASEKFPSSASNASPTKVQRTKTTKVVNQNSQNNGESIETSLKNDVINAEFDDDFYKNIGHNIRVNLNNHIDGKVDRLQLSKPAFDRISAKELAAIGAAKTEERDGSRSSSTNNGGRRLSLSPPSSVANDLPSTHHREHHERNPHEKEIHESTNFELSTPFPALLTVEQYGFGDSNPNKNKRHITKNSWKWKWDLIKKYKYVNEGGKIVKKVKQITTGLKDLSQLDMWTQLSMRSRYESLNSSQSGGAAATADFDDGLNDSLSTRLIKAQNLEQLNSILDKRLKPEINIEQLQQTLVKEELVETEYVDEVANENEADEDGADNGMSSEVLSMFKLAKSSSSKATNPALSGEWARPRCFVCVDCGQEFDLMKSLNDHKNSEHPYVVSAHYEVVGRENLEQKLYRNLFLPKKALQLNANATTKSISSINSDSKSNDATSTSESSSSNNLTDQKEKECTKCMKMIKYSSDIDIYRHILDCIEDRVWMQAKKRSKYRRSRRKCKKNMRRSRLSTDQKKSTSSPFQKDSIEGENSTLSISNPPTPKEDKKTSAVAVTAASKAAAAAATKADSFISDTAPASSDGMNIKSFFRVSKTTPNLPQKIVVQMLEMPPNSTSSSSSSSTSLRHSLRSSAKKLPNNHHQHHHHGSTAKSKQADESEAAKKDVGDDDAVAKGIKEETISDKIENENTITEEKSTDVVDTSPTTAQLPALQIADASDRMKPLLLSPTSSPPPALISPTSCSTVPKKKKKLNDCIAMLTCKIQEKLGVNFFDNTVSEIFPAENAPKHEAVAEEELPCKPSISPPSPCTSPSIAASHAPAINPTAATVQIVPQQNQPAPPPPPEASPLPSAAPVQQPPEFVYPVQDEVIDLSVKKKPEIKREKFKFPSLNDDNVPKVLEKQEEKPSVDNEPSPKVNGEQQDANDGEKTKTEKESVEVEKDLNECAMDKDEPAKAVEAIEEEKDAPKNLIDLSEIRESLKISISKDKIPNLEEILKENHHVITVNNLKISDAERRAFEEQKNRIRQILSKTKKTAAKKQTKRAQPAAKKSPAKKSNAKEPEVKADEIAPADDKGAQEKFSSKAIEIPEEEQQQQQGPAVNDDVKKEVEIVKPASKSTDGPTPAEKVPKQEENKAKDPPAPIASSENIENKIQAAIKTTNRIRCRRLSVVVDPIIHLSAFQSTNRKIRLTNNSQQNGFYDLLTNDQLFNAIKPQLKDEIQKSVKSAGKNSIKDAIEEVFGSKAKSKAAATASKTTPAKATAPKAKAKSKKTGKRRRSKFSRKTKKSRAAAKQATDKKTEETLAAIAAIKPVEKKAPAPKQALDKKADEVKPSPSAAAAVAVPKKSNKLLPAKPVAEEIEVQKDLPKGKQQKKQPEHAAIAIENKKEPVVQKKKQQKQPSEPAPTAKKTQSKAKQCEEIVDSQLNEDKEEGVLVENLPVNVEKSPPPKSKKANQKQTAKIEEKSVVVAVAPKKAAAPKSRAKPPKTADREKNHEGADSKEEDKLLLDISLSSDTSNENDIPLAKLMTASHQPKSDNKVTMNDESLAKATSKKTPKKAAKKKSVPKSTRKPPTTKETTLAENEHKDLNLTAEAECKHVEVKIEALEIASPQKAKKAQKENTPKLIPEKTEIFDLDEDSFFNDDNDIDQADEKINDLVNNIINSSELIDSESEKIEAHPKTLDLSEKQEEAKCFVCKKSFKNEKVLEKHNTTSTHLFKEARRERRIAEMKEKEALKLKEEEEEAAAAAEEKGEQALKVNENPPPLLSSPPPPTITPDEIKIFRTKGALKTFDNILPSSNNHISDVKSFETSPPPLPSSKEFKPLISAASIPDVKDFKSLSVDVDSRSHPVVIDDDENDDLSRKDKIFDSLFSNIENKLQAAAANAPMPPSQKFAFPSLTPQESEVESSSTSWDLQHDADIEWDGGDNNGNMDGNSSSLANAVKEKLPKKMSKPKETAMSIPTKSLIMGKIFKKHRDREKQKTPQADAPNNKPGIKNSLDEIFDHLKNSAEIDDKVLTCPSPKTLLKSSGSTFSPQHSNDMLETASQSNNNNNIYASKPIYAATAPTQDKQQQQHQPSSTTSASHELQQQKKKKKEEMSSKSKVNDNATTTNDEEEDGIGVRKSRRRCAIKAKTFAETWSSDEYEELHDTNDIISIINEIEKRESNANKKRKSSKSECLSTDNNVGIRKSEEPSLDSNHHPNQNSNHHHHQQQQPKSVSILKSSEAVSSSMSGDKKSAVVATQQPQYHSKKCVQLQFPAVESYKEKSSNSASKRRRMSSLKDGHRSDDETFTATKDLRPLKPSLAAMKKRRMSCFVPSTAFNDSTPAPPPPPPPSSKSLKKHSNISVTSHQHDLLKKSDRSECGPSSTSAMTSNDGKSGGGSVQKKILSALCNSNSNNNPPAATAAATAIAAAAAAKQKKIQKHRKRPRNKVKNIAYDSDSDFELNISRKSKNATSTTTAAAAATTTFSDSGSEEEEEEKDEDDEREMVMPTSQGILMTKGSTSSSSNSSSHSSSSSSKSKANELTMTKEPKLLPNDLNVVQSTTTANAAIPEDMNDPMQSAGGNRTKRHSSEKLYYWSSSSSESDMEHGDTADGENNEDSVIPQQPEQHGWIVGDSHKKLVTLLAHAKIKNKIN